MSRLPAFLLLLTLSATSAILLSLNGCGGGGHNNFISSRRIQHIVMIVQENRSPDNLFQDSVLISRGADIVQSGLNHTGVTIPLTPTSLVTDYDISHLHPAFLAMYDGGKMDGFDLVKPVCSAGAVNCPPPNAEYQYVNPSEIQPYFALAEQYTFGDRMFQTNQGPSFPAHQFLISGTSAASANSGALYAAENPINGTAAGCIAIPGTEERMINITTGDESVLQYPCFDHPTLTDLLDNAGISWRYYAPNAGSIWTGPDAIQHMCQPQTQNGKLVCTGAAWSNVIIPQSTILNDIANQQLAQVTWVIPDGHESDHANVNDGSGPSWVASVVNAIGNSLYWGNTAIFITWDDWGGWYDHVAPKIINSYEYGFRVPLIVVSPYAKANYISHTPHDFGSLLKFVEENFGLPSLGYADVPADDFSDCFDFNQAPLKFQTIPSALDAQHFLNDPRPPTDPDDD